MSQCLYEFTFSAHFEEYFINGDGRLNKSVVFHDQKFKVLGLFPAGLFPAGLFPAVFFCARSFLRRSFPR